MRKQLPPSLRPAETGHSAAAPLDVNDLAVRLEMEGVTDAVARADFGYSDVWEMAGEHLHRVQRESPEPRAPEQRFNGWREYLRGISFAFPLLFCALTMAWLKFSLWGGDVEADLAAAIGLGTVLSFMATGGVIQVMANRCLFFSGVKEFRMSERAAWNWVRRGFVAVGATSLLLFSVSAYFDLLPHPLTYIAAGFHICLGTFWLAASLLYILDRTWEVMAAVVAGVVLVVFLRLYAGAVLTTAQLCGILLVSVIGFAAAAYHLRQRSSRDPLEVTQQSLASDILLAWPYFVYGTFYYVFLFADRLMAWTAATFGAPLSFQFRGAYETALDIALIAFVLQVGWVLPASGKFFFRVQEVQKTLDLQCTETLNRQMQASYWRTLLDFAPLSAVASLTAYAAALGMGLLTDDVVHRITLWALAGYPFLVVGLFNSSLLFRLSRASATLKPILAATALNLIAGYLCSRSISFEWAVLGFVAGGVLLAVLSTLEVRRHLSALDYHYYATGA